MYDFSQWLIDGIISGYKSGEFTFAKVTELTAAYISKGFISTVQADSIITETTKEG